MSDRLDLAGLVAAAAPEELPTLIGQLEAAKAVAWARLATPTAVPPDGPLLTMPEVAERLGVTEHQAREMGRRRELPVVTVGARHVRVSARALEDWIKRSTLMRPRER